MLKAREILRLKKAGLSLRDIARSTGCGKTTVSEVLSRAEKENISYPIDLSDKELMSKLYPPAVAIKVTSYFLLQNRTLLQRKFPSIAE